MIDQSNGYEAFASWWSTGRKGGISPKVVLEWARELPPGAAVLDLGCGDGFPMSVALAEAGFDVHGVDASPTMVAGFRKRLPNARVECAAVEASTFFDRTFDGVMSWGLMFLLAPEVQRMLIVRVALALKPAGRFVFTAPWQTCGWNDALTGHQSISLGRDEYTRVLGANGLVVDGDAIDEGENYYYMARKASKGN